MRHAVVDRFETWRGRARELLSRDVAPEEITWLATRDGETLLDVVGPRADAMTAPAADDSPDNEPLWHASAYRVPRGFLALAAEAGCHRNPSKWDLLYHVLWRLTHGEPELLAVRTDPDVRRLKRLAAEVRGDVQRTLATLSSQRSITPGDERLVAWLQTEHFVLRRVAAELVRKRSVTPWTIITSRESADWDTHTLRFGPGLGEGVAEPDAERLAAFRQAQFTTKFRPNRASPQVLPNVPDSIEANLKQVETPNSEELPTTMRTKTQVASAALFLPARRTLPALKKAATTCEGCELYLRGTQTVFGEGPADAAAVFIGEQPGDQEDLVGRPFVGPAGKVLADALAEVGIDRDQIYVTNAVKHFKWTPRGMRRLHAKPSAREITACHPWLEAELEVIKPQLVVCLGATAAQAVLGPSFRITKQRGRVLSTDDLAWVMATYHPSALLRVPDETTRAKMQEQFLHDLQLVAAELNRVS